VSQRRRAIATAVLIAGFALGLLPGGAARASEGNDIQDLRREISRMRAEVEAMQVAITQANDLERQRTERLRKALDAQPEPSAPAATTAPASSPAETTEPPSGTPAPRTAPASDSEDKARGSTKHKRHKRSGRARAKAARAHAADSDR